jgi:DNA-directed RNA polymerase subunit RPC12/RpoP
MFKCERCGSRYSAMHAAAMENCPRCLIRDRVSTPLAFKAFRLADRAEPELPSATGRQEREQPVSV